MSEKEKEDRIFSDEVSILGGGFDVLGKHG